MSTRSRHLHTLKRRAEFLSRRISCHQNENDLTYDLAERAALVWVISRLTPDRNERSEPLTKDHRI